MQYAVGMQYTVGTQYAVRYTVCSRYSTQLCRRYTVQSYAVGVSAKRSTHTVDLANMGGGDCYL